MTMTFRKATKFESKLKLAFIGPAGSGKTYSALAVGAELARLTATKMAVIDTERGSASLYADLFAFDVLELETFSPTSYVEAIKAAEKAGYGVIVVDSLSHAWTGKEGALEQVDKFARREQGNSFGAWRHVTPMHNLMVDAVVSSTSHLIATMRVKTEYVLDKNEKTGKTMPRKVGLAPVQRDGLEYEFSVVGDLDQDNVFAVTKTRCHLLNGAIIERPGAQLAATLVGWLRGEARPAAPPQAEAPQSVTTAAGAGQPALIERIQAAGDLDALRALYPEATALPKGSPERRAVSAAYSARKTVLEAEVAAANAAAEAEAAIERARMEQAARDAEAAFHGAGADQEPDELDEAA